MNDQQLTTVLDPSSRAAAKQGVVEEIDLMAPVQHDAVPQAVADFASHASAQGVDAPAEQDDDKSASPYQQQGVRLRVTGYNKTPNGTPFFRAGPNLVGLVIKIQPGKHDRKITVTNKPHDAELVYAPGNYQDLRTVDMSKALPVAQLWYANDLQTGAVDKSRLNGYLFNTRMSFTDNKNKRTGTPDWDGFAYLSSKINAQPQQPQISAKTPTQPVAAGGNEELAALTALFNEGAVSATAYKAKRDALLAAKPDGNCPILTPPAASAQADFPF